MTWRVLISAPYFLPVIEKYRASLEAAGIEIVPAAVVERLEEHELLEVIGAIDGVICGDDRFTERVFAAASRLKVISKWGTGIDSIDQAAAKKHGVRICNTPNAFTEPVADTVLAYMLSFARNVPWQTEHMRAGNWEKLPGFALGEKTLGIVGVGNIGAAVARRAKAFGMTILGNDIRPIDERVVADTGLVPQPLPSLLAQSDFVTIHCDLNETSRHLISTPQLAGMQRHAILINTSRGPVVDEVALVSALETGTIAGAALDVFEDEPLPLTSPLRRLPMVLLAAHNSNSSPKAWNRVHESTVRNLLEGLRPPVVARSAVIE